MKFSRLVDKFEKLTRKYKQGSDIKPSKLENLQQLLDAKKSRYEVKLAASEDPDKRRKIETRLKVVTAQLEKAKRLGSGD